MSNSKVQQATVGFAGNIDIQAAGPIDAKTRAAAGIEDLTKSETWTSKDGNLYIYNGLMAVLDDGSIYVLTDVNNYQEISSWKKVGSDEDAFVKKVGDTMTGPLVLESVVTKANSNGTATTSTKITSIQGNEIKVFHDDNSQPAVQIKRDNVSLLDTTGKIVFKVKMTGGKGIQIGAKAQEDSIALGQNSFTSSDSSLAIGVNVHASGDQSFAFGRDNTASASQGGVMGKNNTNEGNNSLVGGADNSNYAEQSLVFGYSNTVEDDGEVAGANKVIVGGSYNNIRRLTKGAATYDNIDWAAADPNYNVIYPGGENSFVCGYGNTVCGENAAATGANNNAYGRNSHVEGYSTTAYSADGHAEGDSTIAVGKNTHAEGDGTIAYDEGSHAEGRATKALGHYSHAEGYSTTAGSKNNDHSGDHAEGYRTIASGDYGSHAEGSGTQASGTSAHAEGSGTQASGYCSHAEGNNTRAEANNTHTEGNSTTATGDSAHAEGSNTKAQGVTSHAEGQSTTASGYYSHSEGISTTASGDGAHSEGNFTKASGENAHAEGLMTEAFGTAAHASGSGAKALGSASCAEGVGTIASQEAQHATGKYNASDNNALFIVGGGSSDSDRKNLFTVNTNGTATVATDPIKDMDVATKKYVDDVKDYAISLNGQAAKITKKNTIIDERSNSIEFYSGYNSTLLEDFTAVNISQIAKGATTVTGTNWWGFSRPTTVGTTLYYPLIYFSSVSVKLIFNITITKTTTNKSATYPVCMLADTPPTYTAVILSELPKGLDFVLSRKPDDPSSEFSDTSQLLSLKVDSSFLSECEVKIQLKQYSFVKGDKLGLKMITGIEQSDSPSYEKLVTDKNWVDYMEETTQLEKIANHTSLIGTEIPWQSLEEAVAQSTANQADGATKGDITLNYNPNIFLNVDNITFEVGSGIPDTSYLYYTFKNFTNKLALS